MVLGNDGADQMGLIELIITVCAVAQPAAPTKSQKTSQIHSDVRARDIPFRRRDRKGARWIRQKTGFFGLESKM